MAPSIAAVLTVFASSTILVDSSAFLQQSPRSVSKFDVERTLSELAGFSSQSDVQQIEAELGPMYLTLPRNKRGLLEAPTVRYALHRYFVEKHGWYMQGLEPSGEETQAVTTGEIMKERAPAYIQELLVGRLKGSGLGLHDLAVFAATMTKLVHNEATQELQHVFDVLGHENGDLLRREDSDYAVKAYFALHLLEIDALLVPNASVVDLLINEAVEVYPNWEDTYLWVQDLRLAHDYAHESKRNPFVVRPETFSGAADFVQYSGHSFGSFQQLECRTLKEKLMDLELQGTGRVRLSRFYAGALDGDWSLTENPDYLRLLGVLDETDPMRPSVVISNYLVSRPNCLKSSGFYSVCCMNECESLLRQLEHAVSAPSASAQQLIGLVADMPSDTVSAPRNLSTSLVARLDQVARFHGGMVPLHGRLFAQWLHHAYPRECPFPHVKGSVAAVSPDEWEDISGADSSATEAEMLKYQQAPEEGETSDLPWTDAEELIGSYDYKEGSGSWSLAWLRPVAAVAVIASAIASMSRSSNVACATADHRDKHLV
jgi:hypothetical protein